MLEGNGWISPIGHNGGLHLHNTITIAHGFAKSASRASSSLTEGMIVGRMILQGIAIVLVPLLHGFGWWTHTMALLGLGTALIYPTLLAAVSDVAHPHWRASAVGVYRLWRDSGYALGTLLAGVLADMFGVSWAIGVIAALIVLSGVVAQAAMAETLPRLQHTRQGQLETKEA
jgi:MFS family permease